MKINAQTPKQSINKAFLKQPVNRDDITLFKTNLQILLGKINDKESEEHHKNFVRDFLKNSFYKSDYEINTKGRQDLVIHTGKSASDKVGVILEAKKPTNRTDMISADSPNRKALHELVLYFLRERIDEKNNDVRKLVITNINEWFIFDASVFNRLFFENKAFVKDYEKWRDKQKTTVKTNLFYNEIAKPYIEKIEGEIDCTYFDIRKYQTALENDDLEDDDSLIELFKILSPQHLLKIPFADDSNKLDRNFYTELLHIIGLEETKEKSKLKIDRKAEERRNAGSLIENAMAIIETKDCLHKVKNLDNYGATREERLFNVALELCLTWINRVLFLKLLEAQLVEYHGGDRAFRFLDKQTISDFDELFTLFHDVLAKTSETRSQTNRTKYARIPYLNSSLFEISELEGETITVESLKDTIELPFNNSSILKESRKNQSGLTTLEYLFSFLDAYDFASEGAETIIEQNRPLINASVLGKIFEKINNSKAGSIYTPGFITMYMCRQAIRLAVVQKFKDAYGWQIAEFSDLKNYLADRRTKTDVLEFNRVINSLHLCDPAVGSGHFLVSALNEIIAVKSELGILADADGTRIRDVEITVENDELTVFDADKGEFFKYQIRDGKPASREAQRIQKTLFHEKQTIIENCLFGVDIIPHSVKICRLRLWIELLKNAYYKESGGYTELETLPNIDINIKTGNSLLSRYKLKDKFQSQQTKKWIAEYSLAVSSYKNEKTKEQKNELKARINNFHSVFSGLLEDETSKLKDQLNKKIYALAENQNVLFTERNDVEKEIATRKLKNDIAELESKISLINAKYNNSFEWRFEFPEVLDEEGNFIGFDAVIGNPPYIRHEELGKLKDYLKDDYKVFTGTADILVYFYELGLRVLKPNGKFSFITSNKFMRANYGKPLRQFLWQQNILDIVDFGELPVFDIASTFPVVVELEKARNKKSVRFTQVKTLKFDSLKETIDKTSNVLSESAFSGENWTLTNSDSIAIIDKIKSKGIPLGKYLNVEIKYGIKTGFNEAFVIDEEKKNELIQQDENSIEVIVPFVLGDDIRKYQIRDKQRYLLLMKIGTDITRYSAVFEHLKQYKVQLEKRWDKGENWWELRACAYYSDFEKPKIIYPIIGKESRFALSEDTVFTNDKAFIIPGRDLFLLAFLNSKIAWFYLKNICSVLGDADKGGRLELRAIHVQTLPILKLKEKDQKPFAALVDQILELKKQGKDVQALENEIDRLVYRLYDLTAEEIAIVEGK